MSYTSTASDRLRNIDYERMRKYRVERTKKLMEEDGIDAIIAWEPWDVRYIASCYVPMSSRWSQQQFVVLPKNGEPHLFSYTCYTTEGLQKEMPWLEGRVWAAPKGGKFITSVDKAKPFVDSVSKILAEYDLTGCTVGFDICPNDDVYKEAMEKAGYTVVDALPTMFKARSIKNEDELACVRYACHAADGAFAAIQRAIKPGMRECDLQGIGMEALYELGADETMDFVFATGPRSDPLHIDFTDRIIRPGDYVVIDINGNSFQGYKSCYYRTFICGEANKEQQEGFEVARKLMYDAMSAFKAGNTTNDIVDKWPQDPEFWGMESRKFLAGYALFHGIGLSLHEYPMGGVGGPPDMERPDIKLETGMCFAVETYFGDRDHAKNRYGTRLEECIAVTDDGYELFTRFPVGQIIECPF